MKRIITLTTDFGLSDTYVAQMKGVILALSPRATLVDLTHDITPYDRTAAGRALFGAMPWFPEGTLHVVVVDPGVGSQRRILLGEVLGQWILFPDNGLITPLHQRHPLSHVRIVENPSHFLSNVSSTFHGRDIFAPLAARLASGAVRPESVGRPSNRLELDSGYTLPKIERDSVKGRIVGADRFGNLQSNIHREDLLKARWLGENGQVWIGEVCLGAIKSAYHEVRIGEMLALIDSSGFLEIAVHQGSALASLGMTGVVKVALPAGR